MRGRRVLLVAPNDGCSNVWIDRAFASNGWLVEQFDYRSGVTDRASAASMNHALFRAGIRREDPFDLALILKGELITPGTIEALRGNGPTVALWHLDPREGLAPWVWDRARVVNYLFTIGKGLVPHYLNDGINAHWLLEGADELAHAPPPDAARNTFDLGFVGTIHDVPGRRAWLARIADAFPHRLHLWGSLPDIVPKSQHHGRSQDLSTTIAMTSVNLGRDRDPLIERSYGARLFRTLASGGFLVTNKTIGIDEDFDGCVMTYDSDEDCVRVIRDSLDDPATRRVVAERGRERVLKKHLFKHRIKELVSVCGVD